MIFIVTKFSTKVEAESITRKLLEQKMVLSGTMEDVSTLFLHDGKIEKADEVVVRYTTLKQNFKAVEKEINILSSNKAKSITAIKINTASGPYYQSLKKEVKKQYGKRRA